MLQIDGMQNMFVGLVSNGQPSNPIPFPLATEHLHNLVKTTQHIADAHQKLEALYQSASDLKSMIGEQLVQLEPTSCTEQRDNHAQDPM